MPWGYIEVLIRYLLVNKLARNKKVETKIWNTLQNTIITHAINMIELEIKKINNNISKILYKYMQ